MAFLPAVDNDFTNYDDPAYVTGNPHVQQGLTRESVQWAFFSSEAANWHPLTWLSHILDWQFFGPQAWGHHLTSIWLHALNGVLAFAVLKRMTGATWRSFIVALLFGLHPLRVESVAWVAERKDVLSATFWMLTLWAYARYTELERISGRLKSELRSPKSEVRSPKSEVPAGGHEAEALDTDQKWSEGRVMASPGEGVGDVHGEQRAWYLGALVSLAAGLMSKPMLVTVPCVLLLLDYWPLDRWRRKGVRSLVIEKVPFFLATLVVSAVTVVVQKQGGAMSEALPFGDRLGNALVAYWRYLGKVFWPTKLAAFYPPAQWNVSIVFLAGVLLAVAAAAVFVLRRRQPYFAVGWLWFIGTLVPVIGLVPAGEQSMADRYSYIPSLGIFLVVVWGGYELTTRWRCQVMGATTAVTAATLVGFCLTRNQVSYWKDSETLFRHALLVTQGNFVAHNNLGAALQQQGRLAEAKEEIQEALREKRGYAIAYNNLGVVLSCLGRPTEAASEFLEAIRLMPEFAEPHYHMGILLQEQGRLEEAVREYQTALRLKLPFADAHYNLGVALVSLGRSEEAIGQFEEALKLQPNSPDAHISLGQALGRKGQVDGAIAHYREALRLMPDNVRAHFWLGFALNQKGLLNQAIAEFRRTLELKPDHGEARTNLEILLGIRKP